MCVGLFVVLLSVLFPLEFDAFWPLVHSLNPHFPSTSPPGTGDKQTQTKHFQSSVLLSSSSLCFRVPPTRREFTASLKLLLCLLELWVRQ